MKPRSLSNKTNSCLDSKPTLISFTPLLGTTIALTCVAMPFQHAQAQEELAEVNSSEAYLESIPPNLPGHDKGAREGTGKDAMKQSAVTTDPESWFNWEYATGDWNGACTELLEHGIDFQASYTVDWATVLDGGIKTQDANQRFLDFNITFDLEQLFEIPGATFFLDYYSTAGTGINSNVGDYQGTSNIELEQDYDILAEVWWEQWLFDDALRLKIGKVEGNSEFGFVEAAGDFIHCGPGLSPTIFTLPSCPDPALSVNAFFYPQENLYLGFGFYDGAAAVDGVPLGRRGPSTFFSDEHSDDYFLIGEFGCNYENLSDLGPGRFALGIWHHTGEFATFSAGMDDGTEGFYAIIEQQLWQADQDDEDSANLWGFGQYGHADDDVSEVGTHLGGGLVLNAPFADRPDDALGAMISFVDLSDETGAGFTDDETALEFFYKLQLTPFASVKPDLQFISNPGGDSSVSDAIVGTLRLEFIF